jgi:hypothetical protein
MKRSFLIFAGLTFAMNIFCQDHVRITASFDLHLNRVFYNATLPYEKSTGYGYGFQLGLESNTAFSPVLEYDFEKFFMGSQELVYITFKGKNVKKTRSFNFFGGAELDIFKGLKMDLLIGPCFLDSYKYLAIKPAMGYSFGKNERFFGKASFTYIRTIYGDTDQPYEYLSFSAGIKIF